MKDVRKDFECEGVIYPLVFNLNVMELIQEQYGSVEKWGDLTDGTFYGKQNYEKKNGEDSWELLTDDEKLANKGEPDAKSIIFGFCQMINEGIDIDNEELVAKGENPRRELSLKQTGRLITQVGLEFATTKLQETVIESQKVEGNESKNE